VQWAASTLFAVHWRAERKTAVSKKNAPSGPANRTIQNRRARFDYEIIDTLEVGVALVGSEVKSLLAGRAHLTDAYVLVRNGELWLHEFDIEPYEKSSSFGHERRRSRKLLAHRRQIETWDRRSSEKGLAMIPLRVYFGERGKVKVEIALGRGKAQYDKRKQIAKDDARREVERARTSRD
jgi:SsrA-binding protein